VSRTTLDCFEPDIASRRALWELIVDSLRRVIVLGELPSGVHLEEPALAAKFGVSRIPVREALVRLEHEGLVCVEPRRGAFIVGVSEDDIHDIYELRLLLERRASRRAAERLDAVGLARLKSSVDQMDEAQRRGEWPTMAEADVQFHRNLVLADGSRQLSAAWARLAGLVGTILDVLGLECYGSSSDALHGHQRIIEALAARDADRAEREVCAHLEVGEREMREAIRSMRAKGASA